MARSYRHIQEYEKEIIEMKEQGLTHREVAEKLGFTKKQVEEFIYRYKKKVQKLTDGIVVRPKGRPTKDVEMIPPSIQQLSKVSQLQYELARKEARIKALEMENELMRDFLSLTERK